MNTFLLTNVYSIYAPTYTRVRIVYVCTYRMITMILIQTLRRKCFALHTGEQGACSSAAGALATILEKSATKPEPKFLRGK